MSQQQASIDEFMPRLRGSQLSQFIKNSSKETLDEFSVQIMQIQKQIRQRRDNDKGFRGIRFGAKDVL